MISPVIVALDYPDEASSVALAKRLSPALCRLKIGKEAFTRSGPDVVRKLQDMGFEICVDGQCACQWRATDDGSGPGISDGFLCTAAVNRSDSVDQYVG